MAPVLHVPAPIKEPMPVYPIPPEWVLEGQLDSRGHALVESADGKLGCGQWRCTPGKFRWECTVDEFIWLVEGEATVSVEGGKTFTLRAGDTAHFPVGSVVVWTITRPVHKVFFYRQK